MKGSSSVFKRECVADIATRTILACQKSLRISPLSPDADTTFGGTTFSPSPCRLVAKAPLGTLTAVGTSFKRKLRDRTVVAGCRVIVGNLSCWAVSACTKWLQSIVAVLSPRTDVAFSTHRTKRLVLSFKTINTGTFVIPSTTPRGFRLTKVPKIAWRIGLDLVEVLSPNVHSVCDRYFRV